MALENLTTEEFESIKSGAAAAEMEKLDGEITTADGEPKLPEKYCVAWPAIRAGLVILKAFTSEKKDKIIDRIIEAGDNTCKE